MAQNTVKLDIFDTGNDCFEFVRISLIVLFLLFVVFVALVSWLVLSLLPDLQNGQNHLQVNLHTSERYLFALLGHGRYDLTHVPMTACEYNRSSNALAELLERLLVFFVEQDWHVEKVMQEIDSFRGYDNPSQVNIRSENSVTDIVIAALL